MKLGLFTVQFFRMNLEEIFELAKEHKLKALEFGTGNYCEEKKHCDLDLLLNDDNKLKEFKSKCDDNGIEISALSCHGNSLHPQKEIAEKHRKTFRNTILLAEKLGVNRVVNFSGCPGDSNDSKYPNWVTCPWPDDFTKVINWQWEEKILPYWEEEVKYAKDHGVKVCVEMHPGFSVYNPETLLKLRNAVGDIIGATFDPSHLFWQGIDPVAAIRKLGDVVYYVHAKDTELDSANVSTNGVLDWKPYSQISQRSWRFRTVGFGHDYKTWKDIITALRLVGYDDVLSIEHEDAVASLEEGLRKAVAFLRDVAFEEPMGKTWWD